MGCQRFAHYAVSTLFVAATATAQSRPGISLDQTMLSVTTARGRTDTATTVMHSTSAGGDARIELEKGSFPTMARFSSGPHAVMIMRDGGKELFFLNPDEKQYVSFKPFEMMEGAQKMLEGMGGSMVVDTSVSRVKLDSIGPGPVIDGHPTLTYRLTSVMRMTMTMMGQRNDVDTQSTQELQVATDLGELGDVGGMNRFAEIMQSMGFPKGSFDSLVTKRRKIPGLPLRAIIHTTISAGGTSRTSDQTIDTRNVKRLPVPASLFVVPADYKSVAMPAMPGAPAPSP